MFDIASTSFDSNSRKHSSSIDIDETDGGYPYTIIKNMMFAYGDSDTPLDCCQEFMVELIYQQLQLLIKEATELATIRKRNSIGYTEVLFQFRRHPIFIRRLIQYTRVFFLRYFSGALCSNSTISSQIHEVAPKLLNSAREDVLEVEDSEDIAPTIEPLDEKLTKGKTLFDAIREIDITGELISLFDVATTPDDLKVERMRRLAARTEKMDSEMYEQFSNARMMSFCSRKGKKSMSLAKRFLEWLGSPKLDHGVVYVLNYCATEIVAVIVDSAVLVREQEAKIFHDEFPTKSLQLRHYEEALRRNLGYARNKNVLFGYF